MQCPICKQEVSTEGNAFRPFCSERCKLIDLDNWLEGRYRVPETTGERSTHREPPAEDNGEDKEGR
jgi:uncharacterized protein